MSFFATDHGHYFHMLFDELTSDLWRSLEKVSEEQCAGAVMTDLERFEYYFDSLWRCQDTTRILELLKDVIRFRMELSLKFYPARTSAATTNTNTTTSDVSPTSACDEPSMNHQDSDDAKPNLCIDLDHLFKCEEEPHAVSTPDIESVYTYFN